MSVFISTTPHEEKHEEKYGILYGLAAMLIFSMADGVWKYCQHSTSNAVVFCLTFAANATFIILWAYWKKISIAPENKYHVAIYAALFMAEQGLFTYALRHMPLSDLFVLILTTPLVVLIGARFLISEHLTRLQTLSLLSGFGGALIVILSHTENHAQPSASTLALACALLSTLACSGKILFLRHFCKGENVFGMSVWVSVIFAIVGAGFAGPDLIQTPVPIMEFLIVAGALSTVGTLAYLRAFQLCRAPLVSATQYSQMIWATLIGTFIFAEPLPGATIAGIVLICVSGILLFSRNFFSFRKTG